MKSILSGIGLLVVAVIALTVMLGSWYTIDETQRGVLLRNGAITEVQQPGWHGKMPWIDSVAKIDMQTHTKTFGGSKGEQMEAYSADQQPATLRVSVTLHVAPDKVKEMYSRFGGDYDAALTRIISPHVHERVKVVFGQYTAARAITSRETLNKDAATQLRGAIEYDPVFVIESVQVEDIAFSGGYIKSVEARMQAEVEVQQYKQNLEKEKVQANITVTKAQADADSRLAVAKAEAEATKVKGMAEAYAIQAKGDALTKNPGLVSLIQAERWNGILPTTMVPNGTLPMLNMSRNTLSPQ